MPPLSPASSSSHTSTRRPRPPCPRCTPPFPLPSPHPAFHFALSSLPPLPVSGTTTAVTNAARLSALLTEVVTALPPAHRTLWCQLMDGLAVRVPVGDVSFRVPVAPDLISHAEEVWGRHAVPGCPGCAGDFKWVTEDDDDEPGAGFEGYVCDVLGQEGRNLFINERWRHGSLGGALRRYAQEHSEWERDASNSSHQVAAESDFSGVSDEDFSVTSNDDHPCL